MTSKKQNRWRRLLRKAANILRQNEWITGYVAKDANNREVSTLDPAACKFCLTGALARAANQDFTTTPATYGFNGCARTAAAKLDSRGIWWGFNDRRASSKEEVINAILEVANGD